MEDRRGRDRPAREGVEKENSMDGQEFDEKGRPVESPICRACYGTGIIDTQSVLRPSVSCICVNGKEGVSMSHHHDVCDVCGFVTCRCESKEKEDLVSYPKHYTFGKYEVIDVIDDWRLGFYEGQVIKYVARAKHKKNELQDLKKAQWYLNRRIEQMQKEEKK